MKVLVGGGIEEVAEAAEDFAGLDWVVRLRGDLVEGRLGIGLRRDGERLHVVVAEEEVIAAGFEFPAVGIDDDDLAAAVGDVDDDAGGVGDGVGEAVAVAGDAEEDGVGLLEADLALGFAGFDGFGDAGGVGGRAGFLDEAVGDDVGGDGGAGGEGHAAVVGGGDADEDLAFGGAMDGETFGDEPAEFIGGKLGEFAVFEDVFD